MIESSETFFADPVDLCKRIFEWIGLENSYTPEIMGPIRVGNYSEGERTTLDELRSYYAPFNEELFRRLGRRSELNG
jgi:hypothetical protein